MQRTTSLFAWGLFTPGRTTSLPGMCKAKLIWPSYAVGVASGLAGSVRRSTALDVVSRRGLSVGRWGSGGHVKEAGLSVITLTARREGRAMSAASDAQKDAQPAKEVKRMNWHLYENSLGKRFHWLLKMLGFYSAEAKAVRSSSMLFVAARTQAHRKEVRAFLCTCRMYVGEKPQASKVDRVPYFNVLSA